MTESAPEDAVAGAPGTLSRLQLFMLSAAGAVVVANAYYIHPIIADVAADFGVSPSEIGLVPAMNQLALALGIFLLLPLGDRYSNRRLTSIFVAAQFLAIVLMTFSRSFELFVAGSTALGFFTIAPYLLPAYVSKRVPPERLGQATATITTGIVAGILVARAGGGVLAEHYGWRSVYYVATALMLAVTILLPMIMEKRREEVSEEVRPSYGQLLLSIAPIVKTHPEIVLSGAIQALGFGAFISVWLGLGLHLTSSEMGYGTDVVGYLAAFSVLNLLTTPFLGAMADRIGPRKARVGIAALQFVAACMYWPFGNSLWLLIIPIVLTNLGGPTIDVANRMTFLSMAPKIRTRLMTVYIGMMFIGGGLASWLATWTYEHYYWPGISVLVIGMSGLVLVLSLVGTRLGR